MSKRNSDSEGLFDFVDTRAKTGAGKVIKKSPTKRTYSSIPKKQRDMQNRIMATSERKQVMVKVIRTGGSAKESARQGMGSVNRLVNYLDKDEDNNFENRNGEELEEANKVSEFIKKEWSHDFTTRKNGSDILHIVISTPQGSGRKETENSARDFGREFFRNNDYVMIRHDDTNNPHVHFIVKIKGDNGKRLNLNKKDLQLARETFAFHARENGIDVAASYRTERGAEKKFIIKKDGVSTKKTASEYYKDKNNNRDDGWKDGLRKSVDKESGRFRKLSAALSKNVNVSRKLADHAVKLKPNNDKDFER